MKRVLISMMLSGMVFSAHADSLTDAQAAVANGSCEEGVTILNQLASDKDAAAMNQLAQMHLVGKCVSNDHEAAKEWFQKAADAGSLRAQKMLARLK